MAALKNRVALTVIMWILAKCQFLQAEGEVLWVMQPPIRCRHSGGDTDGDKSASLAAAGLAALVSWDRHLLHLPPKGAPKLGRQWKAGCRLGRAEEAPGSGTGVGTQDSEGKLLCTEHELGLSWANSGGEPHIGDHSGNMARAGGGQKSLGRPGDEDASGAGTVHVSNRFGCFPVGSGEPVRKHKQV